MSVIPCLTALCIVSTKKRIASAIQFYDPLLIFIKVKDSEKLFRIKGTLRHCFDFVQTW